MDDGQARAPVMSTIGLLHDADIRTHPDVPHHVCGLGRRGADSTRCIRLRGCKHDRLFLGTYLSYVLRLLQRGGMPAINPILASRYLYRAKGKGCCIEKCLKYVQCLKFYQLLEVSLVARNLINYVKFYHCSKFRQVLKSLRRRQS